MRKRILLVDDEEGVLRLLEATLGNNADYDLMVAHDGREALDIAGREKPDLVILDMLMPMLDGSAVCQTLKQNPSTSRTKVIMLTALTQHGDRLKALAAGADHFMTKPFSPTTLLTKVDEMLSTHSRSA